MLAWIHRRSKLATGALAPCLRPLKPAAGALALLLATLLYSAPGYAQTVFTDSLWVLWSSGWDDGAVGQASWYDLRYTTSAPGADTLAWWASATLAEMPSPPLSSGRADSVLVNGLVPGRRYYFLLRSVDDEAHPSPFTRVAVGETPCRTPLIAPAQFSAANDSGTVLLSWQAPIDPAADSIRIFRRSSPDTAWKFLKSVSTTRTNTHDRGVSVGPVYSYYACYSSACGLGSQSTIASINLAPPAAVPASRNAEFILGAPKPNPSSGATRIPFTVSREAEVRLSILDLGGREIERLVAERLLPGTYQATWRPIDRPRARSGVYFVRYHAPGVSQVRRIVVTE